MPRRSPYPRLAVLTVITDDSLPPAEGLADIPLFPLPPGTSLIAPDHDGLMVAAELRLAAQLRHNHARWLAAHAFLDCQEVRDGGAPVASGAREDGDQAPYRSAR